MKSRCEVNRLAWCRPFACCVVAGCVILLTAALALGEKSIFDDDWTPPPRSGPAMPAAPNRPSPTPPATPVPKSTHPNETPVRPARPPAEPAPSISSGQPARRPVPAAADQAKSRVLMKEAFSGELVDASPGARKALARKLLDEAAKMPDAPSDQFVVLGGAIQSAVEAADLPLALSAADRMADAFDLDPLAVKASAALKMTVRGYAASPENVQTALGLLDSLESADDFTAASRLVAELEQAPVNDPSLRGTLSRRAREIEELRTARDSLMPALLKLKTAPDDPAADFAVGRYTALLRGDWEHGLPLLAKGNNAKLAALAKAALAKPADAPGRAKLADGWWDLAQASSGRMKTILLARAADDYQLAVPGLSGLERVVAEKRAADGGAAIGSAAGLAGTVHLLSLIEDKDLANAGWSRQGTAVVSKGRDLSSLTLPYLAPAEYDIAAGFSRLTGDEDIVLAFPVGGQTCDFVVGADHNLKAMLGKIGGKWDGGNPTLINAGVTNNELHQMEVKVRREGVGGYLDGKRICYWPTAGNDLASAREFTPRSPGLLAIGSCRSEVAFYSVEVTPLHDAGMVARERDAKGWVYNPRVLHPSADGTIQLNARDATVHGRQIAYDAASGQECLKYWNAADEYVTWFVGSPKAGDYTVEMTYACKDADCGSDVEVGLDSREGAAGATPLALHIQDTGGWKKFRAVPVGKLRLTPDRQVVLVKVKSMPHHSVMDLRQVVLTPVR